MRAKIIFSLTILAASFTATRTLAQEGNQSAAEVQELNSHPELNINDDKTLIMDGDAKPAKALPANRDTNSASNNNVKKQEQQRSSSNPSSNKTEEDPLSFNFLYFIIQKFKYSDIIDN